MPEQENAAQEETAVVAEEEQPLKQEELEQVVGGVIPHTAPDPDNPAQLVRCNCPNVNGPHLYW